MRRIFLMWLAVLLAPTLAHAAPLHFVYKGAGCNGVAELPIYEAFLGRKVDGVVDFYDDGTNWAGLVSQAKWANGCWKGKVDNIAAGIPLAVVGGGDTTQQLSDIASGKMDSYFKALAQSLSDSGFKAPFLRIGLEFNGGWFPWRAGGRPAHFIAAFQHVSLLMKTALPGAKVVWNPSIFEGQLWPDQAYPGDAYVDVIGQDSYNTSWCSAHGDNREPGLWKCMYNDAWGIGDFLKFASKHKKSYAFPEWGTGERPDGHGGGDDTTYMANMIPIIQSAIFESYWDYNASDYRAQMTDGSHPRTAQIFYQAFGGASPPSAHDLQLPGENPFPVVCSNCHAVTIKIDASHWRITTWAMAVHPSATLSWNFNAKAINIHTYATKGSVETQVLRNSSSATYALQPNKPVVVEIER